MLKVIKFSANWCGPCAALGPVMKRVGIANPDVDFETIDIDENPDFANKMNVSAVPTMVLVKDGHVVETIVGLRKEQEIISIINKWKK